MGDVENLQKGNAAYSKGEYEIAINYYTQAIRINSTNDTFFCNRSAAYLKLYEYDKALEDAISCLVINPNSHKGYGRKGAAYHAKKQYDLAMETFNDGIQVCPDQEHLQKGLKAARRAIIENSKVTKAVRKTEATKRASKSRTKRVKDAEGVSDFVKQKRSELKLQIIAIQSQLDLINELASMEIYDKLELLFNLIDVDGDGTVDAKELANAMTKRSTNNEISFQDTIENSIAMVAQFDTDGDAKLDIHEFQNYINGMINELGVSFNDFAEFLVIQILFSDNTSSTNTTNTTNTSQQQPPQVTTLSRIKSPQKNGTSKKHVKVIINDEIKAREVLFDMLADERMIELFRLFDVVDIETRKKNKRKNRNSSTSSSSSSRSSSSSNDDEEDETIDVIYFEDVAIALYVHIIEDMSKKNTTTTSSLSHSSSSSTTTTNKRLRTAYTLLLMIDKKNKRTITYEQFGRLVMSYVSISNIQFDTIVDDLIVSLLQSNSTTVTSTSKSNVQQCPIKDQLIESLYVSDSIYQIARDINNEYNNSNNNNTTTTTTTNNRRISLDSNNTSTTSFSSKSQQSGEGSIVSHSSAVSNSSKQNHNQQQHNNQIQLMDSLTFGRLSKLFQLWDIDGDGDLTLKELTDGLYKFQKVAGIDTSSKIIKNDAKTLLNEYDTDNNNTLDTKEFACAIVHFAHTHNNVAIHDLIDFMCVTSVITEKQHCKQFQEAYGRALGKDVIPKLKSSYNSSSKNYNASTNFILEE